MYKYILKFHFIAYAVLICHLLLYGA